MTFAFMIIAVFVIAYILRATGDATIGFGSTFEINDGAADAYVAVPKIVTLGIPNETTGVVESKTLDLPEAVIQKLATIHNGGSFTVKGQLIANSYSRFQAIRRSRLPKNFRVKIPIDTGRQVITVPGIVTEVKIEDAEAEKINEFSVTIEVSGKRDTADTVEPYV